MKRREKKRKTKREVNLAHEKMCENVMKHVGKQGWENNNIAILDKLKEMERGHTCHSK